MPNGQLGHLYFGEKLQPGRTIQHHYQPVERPLSVCAIAGMKEFSLDHVMQEYPTNGNSDYREGAFLIRQSNGSIVTDFKYKSHNFIKGKPKLSHGNLPACYVEQDDEADTLEVILVDELLQAEMVQKYTIYAKRPIITRSVYYKNNGAAPFQLDKALSACIDFYDANFKMIQLSGSWARERHIIERNLEKGLQSISSIRGISSPQHNPALILKRPDTNEFTGEVFGFSLVYSGNFLAQVEVNHVNQARVMLGISPHHFSWHLKPGEDFQTPELVLCYTRQGLNGLSNHYHRLYRERLARGQWRDKPSPILINNWEVTYFDFNEQKLLEIAKESARLGIELFVLDDGWFLDRNDEKSGLGDWFVDPHKIPSGLNIFSEKINELGMEFGLWIEPEMVNEKSRLYQEHPEWVVHVPERSKSVGRDQYVLDFSQNKVVDYIESLLVQILANANINYIKWDMNRHLSEPFSLALPAHKQGEFYHRFILGVYDLFNRLTHKFPHVLFESCSSGGGRYDPGMLYYAPQVWTSDNNDAAERLKIQYGTSLFYPLRSMGAHVSTVPSHQVIRYTSLPFRSHVSLFGALGYEMDITRLSRAEKDFISKQIAFYQDNRQLIQYGRFYRILNPFIEKDHQNLTAWMCVSQDKKEAIVGIYQTLATPNPGFLHIKLPGLLKDEFYQIEESEEIFSGSELMQIGIHINQLFTGAHLEEIEQSLKNPGSFGLGDFTSKVIKLKLIKKS